MMYVLLFDETNAYKKKHGDMIGFRSVIALRLVLVRTFPLNPRPASGAHSRPTRCALGASAWEELRDFPPVSLWSKASYAKGYIVTR